MDRKIEKERVERSFGFPVVIRNAPKRNYNGRWALAIDLQTLNNRVIRELIAAPRAWTGKEVEGVRKWLQDTLRQLADRLGVSHVAVKKWEDAGEAPTNMSKGSEYMLRMEAARELLDSDAITEHEFVELSARAAGFEPDREPTPIEFDGLDLVDDDWKNESSEATS